MNTKIISILSILFMSLIHIGCSDDDFPAPEISNFEIGRDNSKVGYRGSDLHIDANIVAEGRIDLIIIEIHHEGEHGQKSSYVISDDDWEFKQTWDEYNGLKNTRVHKDIDIPLSAEPGDYHFNFKVIDKQGKVTDIDAEIEIKNPDSTKVHLSDL